MTDRIVVLRSEDAVSFVADACAALAEAANEMRAWRSSDRELVETYAELVVACSALVREQLANEPHATTRLAVVNHLLERLRQARAGEIAVPVLDVVDRLHAGLTQESASV